MLKNLQPAGQEPTSEADTEIGPHILNLTWEGPVKEVTTVSTWFIWTTKCGRYRVVYSTPLYEEPSFPTCQYFAAYIGKLEEIGKFRSLVRALEAVRAKHVELYQSLGYEFNEEDVAGNERDMERRAEKNGLDVVSCHKQVSPPHNVRSPRMMKVTREDLDAIFSGLGKSPTKWPAKVMEGKLASLPTLAGERADAIKKLSSKLQETLDDLVKAAAEEQKIEVSYEGPDDDDDDAAPPKKKASKGSAKAAKPATKPAAKAKKAPAAKDKKAATKPNNFKSANEQGKPGVIATMKQMLIQASKNNPVTRSQIVKNLAKLFPDRHEDSMKVTVVSQLPLRLRKAGMAIKEVEVGDETGYYIGKPVK
jgi:hypothetical protein